MITPSLYSKFIFFEADFKFLLSRNRVSNSLWNLPFSTMTKGIHVCREWEKAGRTCVNIRTKERSYHRGQCVQAESHRAFGLEKGQRLTVIRRAAWGQKIASCLTGSF